MIATESFALVIIILVTAIFKIRRRRHLKDTLETRNHVDPERQQTAAPTITASGTHRNSIRNRPLPIPHSAYQPNVQRQESIGRNSTLQQNSPAVQQNDSHEPDRNRDETLINGSACQPIMQCQECFERASDLQQNSLTVRQNSFDRSEGHGYENSMPDSSFQPNMQDHESTFDYSRSTLGYSTLWRNVSVDRQLTPFEREDNANENSISDTALLLNVQNLMSRRGYSKLHRNLSLTGKNSSYGLKDNSNKDRSYENSKPAPPQREFEEQDDGIETDTIPSKSDEIYEEIPDKINFTRMKQRMSDGRHLDRVGQEITDQRHFDLTRQEMPDGRHFNPVNPFHSGIFATRALPVDGVFHPPRLFHAL